MSMIQSHRASEYIAKKEERAKLKAKLGYLEALIKQGTEVHLCIKRDQDYRNRDPNDCGYDHYLDGHSYSFVPTNDNINHLLKGLVSEIAHLDAAIAEIEAGN